MGKAGGMSRRDTFVIKGFIQEPGHATLLLVDLIKTAGARTLSLRSSASSAAASP